MQGDRWRVEPIDTWFFREARPHGSPGGQELGSLFPPAARTLAGALRTAAGDRAGVDWQAFARGDGRAHGIDGLDLVEEIGSGDDLGRLTLHGPWVERDGRAYFPVPANLAVRRGGPDAVERLALGEPVLCDRGRVHLVQAGGPVSPLTGCWLEAGALRRWLDGEGCSARDVVREEDLFCEEPRVGVSLSSRSRTVEEGMLYATRHLRLRAGVAIGLQVDGLDPRVRPGAQPLRLGGEGRQAGFERVPGACPLPAAPEFERGDRGLLLALLTPGSFEGVGLPVGFTPSKHTGATVWDGRLAGVELRIWGGAGAGQRGEGGWDMLRRRPRPIRALTGAGTIWYATTQEGEAARAAQILHGACIGDEAELGRGWLAVGRWPDAERPAAVREATK